LGIQFIDDLITRKYLVNPPEISLEMEETQELGGENSQYIFTYDDYGNCITKSDGVNSWEYAYDYENRLLSITENGQITEKYIYNGDGQRIKKINSDSTRIYIYSGINILYEINMTTQMDAIYIYGPTGRIAKKVNDITEFYHTDHLGSTRLTTSETGAPVTEVQYKPFGEQINTTEEKYT
jgi:YD repeat-containing protein